MHPLATRCTLDPTRTEFYPCSLTLFAPCCHYTTTDQWTGHADADATGAQLRTLQGLVLRLMRGEVAKVESNWTQQLAMKHNDIVTAKRWKAALPHMFICKDDVALMFGTSAHTGIIFYPPLGCLASNSLTCYIRQCLVLSAYAHPSPPLSCAPLQGWTTLRSPNQQRALFQRT